MPDSPSGSCPNATPDSDTTSGEPHAPFTVDFCLNTAPDSTAMQIYAELGLAFGLMILLFNANFCPNAKPLQRLTLGTLHLQMNSH
ncbi:hypothetical protein H6G00_08565 [Leptolyngbya sp. FACHB-541]|uniref:hypothetical protein n=1 Tax=Leptolyngbya sp. FACHB-541 TaxID=2692810 RepID=UPI001683A422|nr:hypothetical protein [Leptolyngbya sp. FACHB-541]MBD1996669.1 hypothetical protein [Leptolyngbya sp. FACHB-541]